jgi:hypothetical protein
MLMKEAINDQAVGIIKTKIANYIMKRTRFTEAKKVHKTSLPLTDMERTY